MELPQFLLSKSIKEHKSLHDDRSLDYTLHEKLGTGSFG